MDLMLWVCFSLLSLMLGLAIYVFGGCLEDIETRLREIERISAGEQQ